MKKTLLSLAPVALLAACSTASEERVIGPAASAFPAEDFDYVGWYAYLGGAESAQYSSLDQIDQIDRSNVGRLEIAWEFPTGEGQPPRFNPVVAGGRMYVLDGGGRFWR
ncbi:hypothetical protein [Altericroceibacterium endophyticum]|uniref:Pyrrolo-quinoline quinone repeat domain-containing protein n=1 Tax=Altericroceibacterium endophyticum TaxID=1808508 RepID=A0A6I4T0W0_9SPHN|nr:hypothetical protein [Altericroceibacterium endophyticum]MXO64558.1 hypothetical protein [Altericroceibacterium endophyticum]